MVRELVIPSEFIQLFFEPLNPSKGMALKAHGHKDQNNREDHADNMQQRVSQNECGDREKNGEKCDSKQNRHNSYLTSNGVVSSS